MAILMLVSFGAMIALIVLVYSEDLRSALMKAMIVHGLVIAVVTEVLSAGRSLNLGWVVWLWFLLALINGLFLAKVLSQKRPWPNGWAMLQGRWRSWVGQPLEGKLSSLAVLMILGITLLVAIVAPPNNYDSLSYHMPRVMHWMQNQSVAHFPTPNVRQIAFPPLSGYVITHLYLLAGGDYFANLVQWLAFLGCIVGTSLLAASLGVSQPLTALVCATIPMALLQAMTPQTDLVVSVWLVYFLYFLFRTDQYSIADRLWLSASLGLAILTKPTAFIFATPFLVLLGYRCWGGFAYWRNQARWLQGVINPIVVTVAGLSLSVPSYARNMQTFGSPLGSGLGTQNELFGLGPWISTILKTLALNWPIDPLWNFIRTLHTQVLRFDVNNPATSLTDGGGFSPESVGLWRLYLPVEDFVASPLHQVLILLALGSLMVMTWQARPWFRPEGKQTERARNSLTQLNQLAIGLVTAFLLYCFLLKWQIWASRLFLFVPIGASLLVAYWLTSCHVVLRRSIAGLLAMVAITYSLVAMNRPIFPLPAALIGTDYSAAIFQNSRQQLYFNSLILSSKDPTISQSYERLAQRIRQSNCRSLGLEAGGNDPEYLLWATLKENGVTSVRIQHLQVAEETRQLPLEFPRDELCQVIK